MMRDLANRGVATVAQALSIGSKNDLRVLMYHRVDAHDSRPHLAPCTLSATPEAFEKQLRYVSENHNVVSIQDVLQAVGGNRALPKRSVLITFDDAYDCFARNAWPVLRKLGLPAVLFVATLYPANRHKHFWWDVIHRLVYLSGHKHVSTSIGEFPILTARQKKEAVKRLTQLYESSSFSAAACHIDQLVEKNGSVDCENDVLTWEEIAELVDQGLDLGAHSHSHPLLSQLDPNEAKYEISRSMSEILEHTGYPVRSFAYPGGAYNKQTLGICRNLPIDLAFTTCRGANDLRNLDRLQIRRINVGRRATVATLKAQLLLRKSWLNMLDKLRVTD